VHYIHDLHLPTLLNHTKGVVVINSTVGLSGLIHMRPVINCGNAIYDIEGLTYQNGLDTFWKEALSHMPDEKLLNKFLSHLIDCSQINGNFYKRLKKSEHRSGIQWNHNNPNHQDISE
jgi:capsular polysaccharide export protein